MTRKGHLFVIPLAIVANTQELLLEAMMTARGDVTIQTAQLAGLLSTTAGAASTRAAPSGDARGRAAGDGC
jgi:hypothetical protein